MRGKFFDLLAGFICILALVSAAGGISNNFSIKSFLEIVSKVEFRNYWLEDLNSVRQSFNDLVVSLDYTFEDIRNFFDIANNVKIFQSFYMAQFLLMKLFYVFIYDFLSNILVVLDLLLTLGFDL